MFKYLVAFTLLTPLIGIYLVESGEYAGSVGKSGVDYGAFEVFFMYAAIVSLVAISIVAFKKGKMKRLEVEYKKRMEARDLNDSSYYVFSIAVLVFNLMLLLVFLFGFNAIGVWMGRISKGVFRTNLGPFGSIAFNLTKITIPAIFAYSTVLYMQSVKKKTYTYLWLANIFLILILGSVWGFKTTGMMMLMPAFVLLFWKVSVKIMLKIAAAFFAVIYISFQAFDVDEVGDVDPFTLLFHRLTIYQGDVSWLLWGKYMQGDEFHDYFPTLLAGIGDTALVKLFDVDKENLVEWMGYHFSYILNYTAGIPLTVVAEGHNVVGTPFSEGLIAGGFLGIIYIAILVGLVVGLVFNLIKKYLLTSNKVMSALLATYFCFNVFPWLTGGSVVVLYHISNLFGYILTLAVLDMLLMSVKYLQNKPRLT